FIGEQRVHRMVKIVVPLRIHAGTAKFARASQGRIVPIILGDQINPTVEAFTMLTYRRNEFLHKGEGRVIENVVGRIQPQCIEMKLAYTVERVFDEKSANFIAIGSVEVDSFVPWSFVAICGVRTEFAHTVALWTDVV